MVTGPKFGGNRRGWNWLFGRSLADHIGLTVGRLGQIDGSHRLDGWQHKDLAVAHSTGPGDLHDLAQNLLGTGVVDPQRDFDLGQEGQRILAAGVLVQIALLPTVAFHLKNGAGLERRPLEGVEDLFGQIRFDDGDNLFQRVTMLMAKEQRSWLRNGGQLTSTDDRSDNGACDWPLGQKSRLSGACAVLATYYLRLLSGRAIARGLLAVVLLGAIGCGQTAYEAKLKQSVDAAESAQSAPAAAPAAAAPAQPAAATPVPPPAATPNANQGSGLTPAGQAVLAPLDANP